MILGKSLFTENGQLLLRAGYPLDQEVLRRLIATGRSSVYILEDGTEEIIPTELISDEVRSRATQAFSHTAGRIAEAASYRPDVPPDKLRQVIARGAEYRNVVDVDRVSSEITSVVDEILDSSADVLDQTLMKSRAGYDGEHAMDTTLISLLIGRRLLLTRSELTELGTAAFLHDLGKLVLPALAAKPPAEYSEEEHLLMREHPVFGQQLLAGSTDRYFMARTAILHHHERQDGLGYPLGLRGDNSRPALNGRDSSKFIFALAEIIAVADAYDNLISHRSSAPASPDQAIRELARNATSAYNSEVVALLAEVISVFPTGSVVRVAECDDSHLIGWVGTIMKPNRETPHHPILVLIRDLNGRKATPRTVDLAAEKYVRLEMIL